MMYAVPPEETFKWGDILRRARRGAIFFGDSSERFGEVDQQTRPAPPEGQPAPRGEARRVRRLHEHGPRGHGGDEGGQRAPRRDRRPAREQRRPDRPQMRAPALSGEIYCRGSPLSTADAARHRRRRFRPAPAAPDPAAPEGARPPAEPP